MIMPDVNVLVYAGRRELPEHQAYQEWMERLINGPAAFGVSELVLSGFVRIVTGKPFDPPTPLEDALHFCGTILSSDRCMILRPGKRHWGIFANICRSSQTTGRHVSDAFLAALAIEHGATWVTADADFARFPGLRWQHPLRGSVRVNPE